MENNNINIKELLEKLQSAKSAEELIEMAEAEGVEIPADKVEELFAKLNDGELSDDEAEAVAGGIYNSITKRKIEENRRRRQLEAERAQAEADQHSKMRAQLECGWID